MSATRDLTERDMIGCAVWSATRGTEGVDELGGQLAPIGGTVVGVDVTADGERVFRTVGFDRGRPAFRSIPESDVGSVEPVNTAIVKAAVRRLCDVVTRGKGPLSTDDAECVYAAWRLAAVLMGGRA